MLADISFFDSPEFWKAIAFILSVVAVVYPAYHFVLKKVRARNKDIISQSIIEIHHPR